MKKILYSINPQEYPDIELDFAETTAVGARSYTTGEVIEAKKTAKVKATQLKEETVVDTRVRTVVNGKVYVLEETTNTAPAGAIVITNPDGEQYVIKDKYKNGQLVKSALDQFNDKYAISDSGFVSTEGSRHFMLIAENITFKASWGEQIFAPAGSMLCIEYGEGEEYSVTNSAFDSTYELKVLER